MARHIYKRILLKISGEGFCKEEGHGIDIEEVQRIAVQARRVRDMGKQLAIVVGGGNIVRGGTLALAGIGRATGDQMGMLATIINALALQDALERIDVETRVLTAIEVRDFAEPFIRRRAIRHLEKSRIVILAGGTGNPFFTTDTAAALRAKEIQADVLLKATKVDGVYTADPCRDEGAMKIGTLSYLDVLNRKLKVMDSTAISLCMDYDLPIVVFNLRQEGTLERVVRGEDEGTRISG